VEKPVRDIVEQCARASHEGTRTFPEVIGALLGAGVEAYQADYRRKSTTYYLPTGETHDVTLSVPALATPTPFDVAALQAAIRGSQRGEVKYPQFLQLSMAAGCVGYIVWLAGRHVTYFGRHGEQHVESFPSAT
jgi:uncharacterized protein YbcV (DUF1398 family)